MCAHPCIDEAIQESAERFGFRSFRFRECRKIRELIQLLQRFGIGAGPDQVPDSEYRCALRLCFGIPIVPQFAEGAQGRFIISLFAQGKGMLISLPVCGSRPLVCVENSRDLLEQFCRSRLGSPVVTR